VIAPKHRIGYIDGLRAVAVLLVAAFHSAKYSSLDPHGSLAAILRDGRRGVDLFFVLSGFCLSYPTLARLRRDGTVAFSVVRYAAHRIVRIIPPYWCAIAFLVLLALTLSRLGYAPAPGMPPSGLSLVDIVKQALFLDGGVQLLNGSFWTLPVEFRWYFLFPILLLVWIKSPRAYIPIIAAALAILATASVNRDAAFLSEFMLGIVAADIRVRRISFGWWIVPATAALIVLASLSGQNGSWSADFNPLWFPATFAFVVCAGNFAWAESLLSVRWLTAIGIASYSIYLVHEPIVGFAEALGVNAASAAALAILVGFAFWLVAERPFVETRVRARLILEFEQLFEKWLPRLGIPRSIAFADAPPPALPRFPGEEQRDHVRS
jgi:peptidoglycan/LPS O-acetylase OafA/YrhL